MFAEQPQHVVPVKDTPNGCERIAKPEIDAADQSAESRWACRLHVQFRSDRLHHARREIRVDQSLHCFEAASVFLIEPGPAERPAFLVEKCPADARNLLGPDFEAMPMGHGIDVRLVVEAAPPKR